MFKIIVEWFFKFFRKNLIWKLVLMLLHITIIKIKYENHCYSFYILLIFYIGILFANWFSVVNYFTFVVSLVALILLAYEI